MSQTDIRPDCRAAAPAGGFSILEVMIAAVILFMIIGATASILGSGQKLLSAASVSSSGDQLAEFLAGQVAERMRNANIDDLKDANGVQVPDNPTSDPALFVYDSFQFREVVGFAGGPVLRKTIWVHALPDGEYDVANQKDDDSDNIWDERELRIREFPPDLDSFLPAPPPSLAAAPVPLLVKDFTDTGKLAGSLGIFDMVKFEASEFVAGKWDQPMTVSGGIAVTRSGNRVMVMVGVLKVDAQIRNPDGTPRVRGFRGTAFVNLYN